MNKELPAQSHEHPNTRYFTLVQSAANSPNLTLKVAKFA